MRVIFKVTVAVAAATSVVDTQKIPAAADRSAASTAFLNVLMDPPGAGRRQSSSRGSVGAHRSKRIPGAEQITPAPACGSGPAGTPRQDGSGVSAVRRSYNQALANVQSRRTVGTDTPSASAASSSSNPAKKRSST